MQKTENYGLNKPEPADFYNVEDFNQNVDIIDEQLKTTSDRIESQGQEISDVRDIAETATNIAKGRNQARVFSTTEAMIDWLSDETNRGVWNVGDNIYIVEVDVPDWWVAEVLEEKDAETGYYYKIAQLETQKVDLTTIEEEIEQLNSNLEKECYFDGLDDVITITASQTYTVERTGEYEFVGVTTTTGQGFISVSNTTNGQSYNNFIYGFNGAYPTVHFRAKKGNVLSLGIAGSVTKATLKKKWRV